MGRYDARHQMSPTPPPDPPPTPAPTGDPATPAEEATPARPGRRWLPRRRATPAADPAQAPAPGGAAESPATPAADGETAVVPAATEPPPPKPDGPRTLRRNRKKLLSQREVAVYDLGGLAFELFRRDMLTEEVMVRRAQEVAQLDDSVRDIDARLSDVNRERRERRNRAPADPSIGCCMVCRTPFRAEARFCWQCGTEVVPQSAGDDQPTVAIPTPPAT